MKKLLFLFSFISVFRIESQSINTSNFEFIDVDILKSELIKNDFVSNYSFSLDYDAILSLDYTIFPFLKKMDPSHFEKVNIMEYKKKRKFRYDFSSNVKFKNIKTLFLNEKLFQKITKGNIDFSDLEIRIYVKNKSIAIFNTSHSSYGSSSSYTYKCLLWKDKIYFEMISGIIGCGLPSELQLKSDSLSIEFP